MDLSPLIREYIQGRADTKLEQFDKAASKAQEKALTDGTDTAALAQQQSQQRAALAHNYQPVIWLSDAAARAKQITLVTHAAKFAHSASRASSLSASLHTAPAEVLGSHNCGALTLDVVGNAASLDVATLLLLAEDNAVLWRQIRAADGCSLRVLCSSEEQLQMWMTGFALALDSVGVQSHSLAKQSYFPVGEGEYHLIAPLHPTSLAQGIYERVQSTRYSELSKGARAQRRAGRGCADDVLYFPQLACMSTGGSKPQNISLLNSRRGGKSYLLSCAPPVWKSELRLPLKGKLAFWRLYQFRVRADIADLRRYLGRVSNYNNKAIREGRARRVTGLHDQFLQLASELRQLGAAGWSLHSQLPLIEQCLLDPQRRNLPLTVDDSFNDKIDDKSWREEIAEAFGLWLNGQLRGMKNSEGVKLRDLGDAESALWRQEVKSTVSRLRNDLELL